MLSLFVTHGQRLQRAGRLLMRHWVVAYPLLLLQLILELLLTPALFQPVLSVGVGSDPTHLWRLLAVLVMALLLVAAFTAGWVGMMVTLIQPDALFGGEDADGGDGTLKNGLSVQAKRALMGLKRSASNDATAPLPQEKMASKDISLGETLWLRPPMWRGFFTAIGQYFQPFVWGWLAYSLVWIALAWWVHYQSQLAGGYPVIFQQVMALIQSQAMAIDPSLADPAVTTAPLNSATLQQQLLKLLNVMPAADIKRLDVLSRSVTEATLLGLLWTLLTACWPAAVVLIPSRKGAPLWRAFVASVQRFFKAPVIWVLLGIVAYVGWLLMVLLTAWIPLLSPVLWFAGLMLTAWLGLYVVLCTAEDAPKVVVLPPTHGDVFEVSSSPSSSTSSNDSPSSHAPS
ncbi:MAG: hypothetical protein QE263_02650 [Vampirovibrionales bacterium]|nr:hypothetical protein [Vampirovibrionales bacterium]